MPELPEVEVARKRIHRALKGSKIVRVWTPASDPVVFDKASPLKVRSALLNSRIVGSGRKGKYFWIDLEKGEKPGWRVAVVFHLGMTGDVEVRHLKSKQASKAANSWNGTRLHGRSYIEGASEKLPRFCRLLMVAENGAEVAFTDPRRFGRIRLAKDPLREPPISELGYDPLDRHEKFPSARKLGEILAKRRAPIKAVLLDQSIFAGVGNWIADEVLYQSRISPRRLASSLNAVEVGRLRKSVLHVIRKAVKVDANSDCYPDSWLFHFRWGKKKDSATFYGHRIVHDTIGGRTTAWVPDLQK
jgi:formamidopyrimidine-DNA glycosylase